MATEMNFADVLCEAMEYLTKLGSNLRSRSENLKEKRIRKDKLKNSHAIQKAAQKVLLICELSKKSLDNVETGVRRVMSHVKSDQNMKNDDKFSPCVSPDTNRFQYFECGSYKLKASEKIPIMHFMSAKVIAKRMSKSILHKYPVYFKCQLLKLRKQAENEHNLVKESCGSGDALAVDSVEEQFDEQTNCPNETNVEISQNLIQGQPNSSHSIESESAEVKLSEDIDKSEDTISKTRSKSSQLNKLAQDNVGSVNEDNQVNNDNISRIENEDRTECVEIDGDCTIIKEKNAPHIMKEIKEITLDSVKTVEKESNAKNIKIRNNKQITDKTSVESQNSEGNQSKEHKKNYIKSRRHSEQKKFKHIIVFEDSSDSGEEKNSGKEKKNEETNIGNNVQAFDREDGIDTTSTKSKQVIDQELAESNMPEEPKEEPVKEYIKPVIKCVSMSKLLKPEVLQKTVDTSIEPKKSSKNILQSQKELYDKSAKDLKKKRRIEFQKHNKQTYSSEQSLKLDEEYWIEKRSEVSTFKAKPFNIDVYRLPKLSLKFLEQHKLKRIIQGRVVVFELQEEGKNESNPKLEVQQNIKEKASNQVQSKNKKKHVSIEESNKAVKISLLNETDSECEDNSNKLSRTGSEKESQTNEMVKRALLDDDSNDDSNQSDNSRNVLKFQSDSDKSEFEQNIDKCNENLSSKKSENKTKNVSRSLSSDSNQSANETSKNRNNIKEGDKNTDTIIETANTSRRNSQEESLSEKNNLSQNKNDNLQQNNKEAQNMDSSGKNSESDSNQLSNRAESSTKRKSFNKIVEAKKMLLRYSSSSDSDDDNDQLTKALRNMRSEEDKALAKRSYKRQRKKTNSSSSSSGSDRRKHVKKKPRPGSKQRVTSDANNSNKEVSTKSKDGSSKGSDDNSQIADDTKSKASRRKMVRSKALPSSSSGQNSDSPDLHDKEIDGLTNLNNLNKVRRRRDSSQESKQSSSTKDSKSMSKPTATEVEEVLGVESSDEASANEADNIDDDIEDLPPVPLTALNGDSGDHEAKDDLLGESDSSVSINEKDKTADESAALGNVKSKRRKANAISSDSEVGSSQRQEQKRVSDFEDSEAESSEPVKRAKRKPVALTDESDGSLGASSTEGSKKKRRRIKQVDSDVSGSDTENEGRNKHGRKNIRKVMGKNQLEEATKKAAREEKERIARIAERQKLYNNLEFDESGKPDEVVLEKVVLDFDPETKEPLIEVDRGLVKKLKPHQANGIKFMWDACFESVKRIKKDKGSGCILAHCMGLGKTLQVVSLTHTLLTHSSLTNVNRVLVVCPLSTVLNWVSEFKMWLKHAETEYEVDVYELSRYKQNHERAFQLQQWSEGGGVCVLGYEMFRNLSADNVKKFKKKMLRHFQEALVDPGPDLVVCDEGHLLKNEKTSLSQSMNRVKTLRRIVLTGTPLQNNLKEYYCMVQFVKPNLLGKYNEYLNRFVNPITNGQYTDSTEHDIRVMKRRSHVLHKMLDGAVQRRDYGVLAPFLPPKHEYVLFITLTEVQIKLYQFYLDNYSRRPQPGKSSGFLFPDFQSLQRIWTHPLVLKYNSERYEIMQQKKREREEEDSEGSLVDFIDDDSTPDESTTEESTDDSSDMSDDSRKKSKKKKAGKKGKSNTKSGTRRGTRANPNELEEEIKEDPEVEEVRNENPTEWWIKLVEEEELEDLRNSHKLLLLFDILRQCEAIGDKLLVFSQSLYSLDLIEHFLGKVDEATQDGRIDEKLAGHVGSWSPGVDYFRLDGSTSCENRSIWCRNFNREDNPRARLFLISTRAGGLGINLVAANRVVIFDVSWNPSHDVQSIFRVYRFGQKKPCYVYRFLAMGTMEEKIYERQVTKQAISKRVIDEQQIDRHYAENDLAELYTFAPHPPSPRPLPPLPKDRLFAEMLREHEAQIYKYHEHDSLLENKEEETLTEEERKAAWEDFENEKNKPPPAPFPTPWPMHNGMMPGLMQQQQMAYAALAAMLRKDMPNINENQIRDMLPLLYNSNPALVQKMNEIYKYAAQPGMMNHMVNPLNLAASGALGGSSGLQYEPPWQRQQQQQHQMRLQQLLQHQQNMGAKYYAGGLGSRDPVAMAMQQQRAREIMMDGQGQALGLGQALGQGQGQGQGRRPRGRPPMQPRLPTAPGDIVDLDSD